MPHTYMYSSKSTRRVLVQKSHTYFVLGEYQIVASTDDNQEQQFMEETEIKNDFNDELTYTLNFIKETNVLKT